MTNLDLLFKNDDMTDDCLWKRGLEACMFDVELWTFI